MSRVWSNTVLVGAIVTLLTVQARAEPIDHRFAHGIERAKRATVGVLDEAARDPRAVPAARFTVRGSAFYIGNGYLVTAQHAVEREEKGEKIIQKEIIVLTADLAEFPASLIGVNAFLDVAIYRSEQDVSATLDSAAFSNTEPEAGDELFTVGYPLGWGPALGFGRLGNPNVFLPTSNSRLFQIDLSACSGNSGGGFFNVNGEVVGVVHAMIQTESIQGERRCSRFAFAVPGVLAHRIVTALISGEQPAFSKLGIQLTVVKMGTRWRVAVSEAAGPAFEGGIRKGDILLSIEDTAITDGVQLKNYLIERTIPGQKVSVTVLRGQTKQVLYVTLGKA